MECTGGVVFIMSSVASHINSSSEKTEYKSEEILYVEIFYMLESSICIWIATPSSRKRCIKQSWHYHYTYVHVGKASKQWTPNSLTEKLFSHIKIHKATWASHSSKERCLASENHPTGNLTRAQTRLLYHQGDAGIWQVYLPFSQLPFHCFSFSDDHPQSILPRNIIFEKKNFISSFYV